MNNSTMLTWIFGLLFSSQSHGKLADETALIRNTIGEESVLSFTLPRNLEARSDENFR